MMARVWHYMAHRKRGEKQEEGIKTKGLQNVGTTEEEEGLFPVWLLSQSGILI